MKPRPTIFLSGVSHEFASFRDAVENEVQKKGCFAENQSSFPPDYRTVEEMLRRKLKDADAVIHIVGFRFGAEPNQRPAEELRRSYTQMEFDIAREMQRSVFVFLSMDETVRDPAQSGEGPEEPEVAAQQLAHRQAVQGTNHLHYFFNDKAELCKLVAEIPPVAAADFRADISRIDRYAPAELIGREDETKFLSDAWAKARRAESPRPHVITFVALGGEGKTSLVAKWAADLAHQGWPGCDAAFAWSFYSQGTREQTAASSDLFLKEALTFFGDPAMASSAQGAFDKGRRLAQLVGERRTLLILDGLEPLQYAPTSPTRGELKDPGIATLLKGLAAANQGLCVVTTRYSVSDLRNYWQSTAPEKPLLRLSKEAGAHLLQRVGVRKESGSTAELEKLVEDVKGHALTLNLLGTYLRDAHAGDIRKRDLVKLEDADEEQGGHAFRVMDAYVKWFESDGEKGQRALAILRLLGLFDRPVTADCFAALLKSPAIPNLTEALVGMTEAQRNIALKRLEEAKLLTVNRDAAAILLSLDAHPLLREYFARQVRTQHPEAWRAAHRRLYKHLCAITHEGDQPTLEDLQPLYQAVAHGCQAGLDQEACEKVYRDRIQRGRESYSTRNLGALSSDLGAVACFFETRWNSVSPALTEPAQAWILNEAAVRLNGLGRLTEAVEPLHASREMCIRLKDWKEAAIRAHNLSETRLCLGEVPEAERDAEQSVTYADRSRAPDAWLEQRDARAKLADVLHQAGRRTEAKRYFRKAEQMEANRQTSTLLYSLNGFRYCDLLLGEPERAAWQVLGGLSPAAPRENAAAIANCLESYRVVSRRAEQTLDRSVSVWRLRPLSIALDHLTLGRAALYRAMLEKAEVRSAKVELDQAVDGLRHAGTQHMIPLALLTRAWLRSLEGVPTGPESAQEDLDEAWEIAERGPMRLHLADIHLYRARLFHAITPYPWESPHADLAAARKLIEDCGYWRRKEELEDAEAAARNW